MKLDVPTLARLSPLMDEALELDDEQMDAWLSNIGPHNADLIPALRELLSRNASVQTNDILQRGPEFTAPAAATHLSDFKANDTVGPYRLIRELGRGGMGEVWLAERIDGSFKRQVALKLPRSALPQRQLAERFARERDILASLVHTNIARLYDAGVSDKGQPYLALEYVQGEMLTTWCDARRLGVKARIELFRQVLAAVQYAHRQLVVHRDLKPSNILVTVEAEVRLLDFGIAKLMTDGQANETELTQASGRALSLQYASPEQVLGQPIATTSDVYSLGVVLHELLTGSLPYRPERSSNAALEEAILSGELTRASGAEIDAEIAEARSETASRLRRLLRGDLETIVLKAIRRNPDDRYATVEALDADLKRFLNGEAVLARPDSTSYRIRKFIGRHHVAVGAGSAVVLALGTGLGAALWEALEARQQAALALEEAHTTEAVYGFLVDMFKANSTNQADPVKARETTARQLLDIGAAKIDGSMDKAPKAKAAVLGLVQDMYWELGLKERALHFGQERLELLRRLRGPDHPDVAEQLVSISSALQQTNQDMQRGPMLSEALRILDLHPESDPKLLAGLLRQLALFKLDTRDSSAMADAKRAVAVAEAIQPSDQLIDGLTVLGKILTDAGDLQAAVETLARASQLAAANPGMHRQKRVVLIAYLGDTQRALGKSRDAEASFRQGFELALALSGPDHVDAAQMEYRLARVLFEGAHTSEGLQMIQSARQRCIRAKGANNSSFLPFLLGIEAAMRSDIGNPEAALPLLDRGLQLSADNTRNPHAAWLLLLRSAVLLELGKSADARAMLDRVSAFAGQGQRLDDVEMETRDLLAVRLLLAEGKNRPARAAFAQVRSHLDAEPTSFADWTRYIQWGELALDAGEPEAARVVAERALSKIASDPESKALELRQALALRLAGKANLAQGNAQAAEPRLRQAVALAERHFDRAHSPELADTQIALADALLNLKRAVEARALAAKARAIHATHRELAEQYRQPLRALEARLGDGQAR